MKFILQYSERRGVSIIHTYEKIEWRDAFRRAFERVRHDFPNCFVQEHKMQHNVAVFIVVRYEDTIATCTLTALTEVPISQDDGMIAWRSTTVGYKKFITQSQYEKFSKKVQAWYEPYQCANCKGMNDEKDD